MALFHIQHHSIIGGGTAVEGFASDSARDVSTPIIHPPVRMTASVGPRSSVFIRAYPRSVDGKTHQAELSRRVPELKIHPTSCINPGPRHLSFSSSLSIPCAEPPRVSPTRWAPLTPGSWRSLHEAQKGMVADQPGESRGNITIRKRALFEIVPAWGKDARQLFAAIAIQMNGQVRT